MEHMKEQTTILEMFSGNLNRIMAEKRMSNTELANGVGVTPTTIGKLAYQFKKAGKKVVLGAADTFRAAAVEHHGRHLQRFADK